MSTQTIRRDLDLLSDDQALRRAHGRIELSANHLNTPFDQRAETNLIGKRGSKGGGIEDSGWRNTLHLYWVAPLSVAQALRRHKELTVVTNNLSAACAQ